MIDVLPLKPNGHLISHTGDVKVLRIPDREAPMILMDARDCHLCDQRPGLRIAEDAVYAVDPCPFPEGITTTITLDVPSGKIIVTDDLRPFYDWDGCTSAGYNSVLGQAQAVEAMAAVGCAYGPVGNSCPGLYRVGEDRYVIASPEYDEDENPSLPESDLLAAVCTDLWAYSIADFEHWKGRGGDPAKLGWSDTVVDVPPGTYRFVHHSGERTFDRDAAGTVVFADVERIK